MFGLLSIPSHALVNTPGVGEAGGVINDGRRGHSFADGKWEICSDAQMLGGVGSGVSFEETATGYGEESMAQVVQVVGRRLRADAFHFNNSP